MIASATTYAPYAKYCMPIELLVCAVRDASHPTSMKAPRMSIQLKPSTKRTIGPARPDSKSPSSTRMKPRMPPTRWV